MRRLIKVFLFSLVVPTICVHHGLIILFIRNKENRTKTLVRSLQNYCRYGLRILQIKLVYDFDPELVRNRLVISNHQSYIDVLCYSSLFPASYVTSIEMKNTPVLGQVCQLCACLFTERRRSKRNSKTHVKEVGQMREYLESGVNIVLFPESTTTPGDSILPFKTSLLESGIQSRSVFQPLALGYSSPMVPWYGDDVSFAAHLWALAGVGQMEAYITLGESIHLEEGEGRKEVGSRLYEAVKELFEKCNFLKTPTEQSL